MDLEAASEQRAVVARPPSRLYRFQKTGSAEQARLCAAAAMMRGALVLGVIVSTWQAVRATRAKTAKRLQREPGRSELNSKPSTAQANEAKLREQAEAEELAARQRAYASDMNVAKQALDGNNLGRAQDLLEPAAAAARPERFARLGMALSLATNPQRCLVHPLPGIERDQFAGGFSGRSMAGGWAGHRGGLSVWDLRHATAGVSTGGR